MTRVTSAWKRLDSLRGQAVLIMGASALGACLPGVGASEYVLHVATLVLIYVPLSIGQTLITGDTGQVAMGQVAYFGIGAYAAAILSVNHGFAFVPIMAISVGAGAVAGLLTGLPAIRISGDYLFIVTIGLNLMFDEVLVNWSSVTGSVSGIPGLPLPSVGKVVFGPGAGLYLLALVLAAACLLVYAAITRSWFGRRMHAVLDDELAAKAVGLNPTSGKLVAFIVACAMSSAAGVVFAYFTGFVGPDAFPFTQSLLIFEMAILGGLGSGWGAVLGAAILVAIPQVFLPLYPISVGLGGIAIVAIMIFRPSGIMGRQSVTTLIRK